MVSLFTVHDNGEIDRKDIYKGYVRGLTVGKKFNYVGVSSKRISSRKQGIGKKYFTGSADEYLGHQDFMSFLNIYDSDF